MSGDRDCERCVHAVRLHGPEAHCHLSPALYTCAEERSMSWLQALLFNACGRSGRFFTPVADAGAAGSVMPTRQRGIAA